MTSKKKELGAAQICVTLENSQIIVRHTDETGEILFKKKATEGDWNKIWDAIRKKS